MDDDGRLARIAERLTGTGVRSSMGRWLWANHDGFRDLLAGLSRVDWTVVAQAMGETGLLDAAGKAPSASGARRAWHRVRAKMQRERGAEPARAAARPSPAGVTFIEDVARPVAQARPDRVDQEDPMARLKRTLAERSGRGGGMGE